MASLATPLYQGRPANLNHVSRSWRRNVGVGVVASVKRSQVQVDGSRRVEDQRRSRRVGRRSHDAAAVAVGSRGPLVVDSSLNKFLVKAITWAPKIFWQGPRPRSKAGAVPGASVFLLKSQKRLSSGLSWKQPINEPTTAFVLQKLAIVNRIVKPTRENVLQEIWWSLLF